MLGESTPVGRMDSCRIPSVLLVEDDRGSRSSLKSLLEHRYQVDQIQGCIQALKLIEIQNFDCVLVDILLPGEDLLTLLRGVRRLNRDCPVIVMCSSRDISTAVEAIRAGADDFVIREVETGNLSERIERLLESARSARKKVAPRPRTWTPGEMVIGRSKRMLEIMSVARRVAAYPATVLLVGESGTGKELFANWIHRMSDRAKGPFVAVNLAAMPNDLVESTLFGHEKGAFTGAVGQRVGKFGLAQDGTLLLDEITELRLDLQPKLLRVLQEGEYERVGGDRTHRNRARIIAATNQDILGAVQEGAFRADLFYRLNVVTVNLPPLRQRSEDIPELAELFVAKYNRLYGRAVQGISPEAVEALMEHDWPGNIRELENVIQRAVIIAEEDQVREQDLAYFETPDRDGGGDSTMQLHGTLEELEVRYIEEVLRRTNGHQGQASKILGIDRKTLYNKIMKYGLRRSLDTPMNEARL